MCTAGLTDVGLRRPRLARLGATARERDQRMAKLETDNAPPNRRAAPAFAPREGVLVRAEIEADARRLTQAKAGHEGLGVYADTIRQQHPSDARLAPAPQVAIVDRPPACGNRHEDRPRRDAGRRCRSLPSSGARLTARERCVVHDDPNPGNIRMTADRVALIDWDESHVDVPDLNLVLPHNAAGLDEDTHDVAAQASAAWEAAVCWDPTGTDPSAEERLAEVRAV